MTAVLPIGVQDGASVSIASKDFKTDDHSVKFKIDIENHTNQKLELLDIFKLSGEWEKIPQHVFPGKKESSFGRKSSGTATGVAGMVSWKIDNGDCAVVMFSLPFDFNLYSNWLSVGIMKGSRVLQNNKELFDVMYGGKESNFTRGQFYSDPKPIEFKNGSYKIVGEMGTTHEAEIKIQIFDEQKEKALKQTKANEAAGDAEAKQLAAEAKAKPVAADAKAKPVAADEAKAKPVAADAKAKPVAAGEAKAKPLAAAEAKAKPVAAAEAKAKPVAADAKAKPVAADAV